MSHVEFVRFADLGAGEAAVLRIGGAEVPLLLSSLEKRIENLAKLGIDASVESAAAAELRARAARTKA
jgi:hypothetical protein